MARTTLPSGLPIRSSWASEPRWVWNDLARLQHEPVLPALGVGELDLVAGRERPAA